MDREDGGEELSRRHLTPLGVHSQMMAYCRALGKKKPYLPPRALDSWFGIEGIGEVEAVDSSLDSLPGEDE